MKILDTGYDTFVIHDDKAFIKRGECVNNWLFFWQSCRHE